MSTGIEIGIVLELAAIVIALLRIGDALREREGEYTRACLESVQLQAELAQARAEIERLKAPLPKNPLCQGDGNCPGVCGGCLELTTNREYRLAIALRDARSERDTLRAQLEEQK